VPRARALAALLVVAGCHASVRYQDTRRGETRRELRDGPPRALAPTVMVTAAGRLRFVEPLVCSYDSVTDLATFDVDRTRPNAATLVVGLLATAFGVVAGVSGLSSDDPSGAPLTYAGAAGLAVGVPLVIGPLVGNATTRSPVGVQPLRRRADDERCGERPVTAQHATLRWDGLRAEGAVDADGVFAISPFDFLDAFDVGRVPALSLAIELERAGGPLRLEAIVDAGALAGARAAFFASRGLDGTVISVAEMRKVPQLQLGLLGVSMTPGPALRMSLPIDNIGPGDAYGVRLLVSSSNPEIDGRIVYLGRVVAHAHAVFDTVIPMSREAERDVASGNVTFSAVVRDAHDVSPSTPVGFRGMVLRTGS